MISEVKLSIFATTQKVLDIFEKFFLRTEAMDHIYHS